MTYANYLSETDQRQQANSIYETALGIVSKEEGERSVAAAKMMGLMADNNYRIQAHSTEDYTVASEQAETALQVIEEKLGKNNFLIAEPKNVKAKTYAIPDKEEKLKLLSDAEKLFTATVGNYNPGTAAIMTNMGITYKQTGRNSEAEELLTKSLAIKEKILGEDDQWPSATSTCSTSTLRTSKIMERLRVTSLTTPGLLIKFMGLPTLHLGTAMIGSSPSTRQLRKLTRRMRCRRRRMSGRSCRRGKTMKRRTMK